MISGNYVEFSFKAEGHEYREIGIITEQTGTTIVCSSENGEFSLYDLDQEEFYFVSKGSTLLHTGETFYWTELFLKKTDLSYTLSDNFLFLIMLRYQKQEWIAAE